MGLNDELGVPAGCKRCGVGALPVVTTRLKVDELAEPVDGGGGNWSSGRIKSRSRNRSVICVNS